MMFKRLKGQPAERGILRFYVATFLMTSYRPSLTDSLVVDGALSQEVRMG